MLHKLNILVLLVFLFIPMSALKADTNTLPTITMINPVEGSIIKVFRVQLVRMMVSILKSQKVQRLKLLLKEL